MATSHFHFPTFNSLTQRVYSIFAYLANESFRLLNNREINYDLASISFDPDKRALGSQTDTLYCAPLTFRILGNLLKPKNEVEVQLLGIKNEKGCSLLVSFLGKRGFG